MHKSLLWALHYACRTAVISTGPTQYKAFHPRSDSGPHTNDLPVANHEIMLLNAWDRVVPINLSTVALGPDDYQVARPLLDDLDLPDLYELTEKENPHVVYRFFDSDRTLLYVGMSSDFGDRAGVHMITKAWSNHIDHSRTTVEYAPSRKAALAREKQVIQVEHPRYNVQHAVR